MGNCCFGPKNGAEKNASQQAGGVAQPMCNQKTKIIQNKPITETQSSPVAKKKVVFKGKNKFKSRPFTSKGGAKSKVYSTFNGASCASEASKSRHMKDLKMDTSMKLRPEISVQVGEGSNFSSILSRSTTKVSSINGSNGSISDMSQGNNSGHSPKPLTRKKYQFRMDRTIDLFADPAEDRATVLHRTRLYKDQKLKKTLATGEDVVQEPTYCLMTRKRFEKALKNSEIVSLEVKTIVVPPFTNLDEIVDGVYLTGFYGMLQENIKQEKISLIINASNEIPLYKNRCLPSYRVPVVDSEQDAIEVYFDEVADLIEENRRAGGRSVVHCMAGVSRSSTLVLAYLLKYTSLNLHDAFVHCKATRLCIRPNLGFFRQLIEYECRLNGKASTRMVQVQDRTSTRKALVPDFFPSECPDLFQVELDRQTNKLP